MRVIAWYAGHRSIAYGLIVTVMTLMLTHLCCIVPGILMPLGITGVGAVAQTLPVWWETAIQFFAITILGFRAWFLWKTNKVTRLDVISLGLSAVVIAVMFWWL